ncbi:MAG TPA: hypothetical protein VLH77_05070 [Gammaproteobacteria bacterium]|nr:hypothetical protein [Gammaproteobacteria bacterium]
MKIQSFRKMLAALAIAAGLSTRIQADDVAVERHGGFLGRGGLMGTGISGRDRRHDYWTDRSGKVVESPSEQAKDLRRNRRNENRSSNNEKRNYNR